MKQSNYFLKLLFLFLLSGCSAFPLKHSEIYFQDPVLKLNITSVAPNTEEEKGVKLRLLPEVSGISRAREETEIYYSIKEGKGMRMEFMQEIENKYEKGYRDNSYILTTNSDFKGEAGHIEQKAEWTDRGEVLRLIRGLHKTKYGKLKMVKWTRTPMFPENTVKIGDEWSYTEIIDLKIDSRWVKQKETTPYSLNAKSKLVGFALVGNTRCAVIESHMIQSKNEKMEILFKDIEMNIQAEMQETTYLDYKTGTLVARVNKTESIATTPQFQVTNQGRSQSIYYVTSDSEKTASK